MATQTLATVRNDPEVVAAKQRLAEAKRELKAQKARLRRSKRYLWFLKFRNALARIGLVFERLKLCVYIWMFVRPE